MEAQLPFDYTVARFSPADLRACVPGMAWETFRKWQKLGMIHLSSGIGLGRGNVPAYTGEDLVQVALAAALVHQGVRVSRTECVWFLVRARLLTRDRGDPLLAALLAAHPTTGELTLRWVPEAGAGNVPDPFGFASVDAPAVAIMVRVDHLIATVTRKMEALLAGEPAEVPEEAPPVTADADPRWSTDAAGRRVLVGLTAAETAEYTAFLRCNDPGDDRDADAAQFIALRTRHQAAQRDLLTADMAARRPARTRAPARKA
jgi:hypothetical protein